MSKVYSLCIAAILFVILASLSIASKPEASYKKNREQFKHTLFERHQAIMAQDRYMEFIERYFKEAEAKLYIPRYLMNAQASSWCANYFNCLINYNVAYFNAYAKTYDDAQRAVDQYELELAQVIELIKAEGKLTDLDVQQEFAKTKELYGKVSRLFYKKLGIGVRLFNFFRTIGQ